MSLRIGSFEVDVAGDGVAVVTFSRPPVNAVSWSVYEDIGKLVETIETDSAIRVVVLTAPDDAKAWCGGADLNDFVGMNPEKRKERYKFINERVPGFYRLDRPVIAAINASTVGVGILLAGICDLRVAAEDARFACPEIDYGLVSGSGGLFSRVNMPEAKFREMLFTGRKFTARELEPTGFFTYVVPRQDVMKKSLEVARQIAAKSLPSIRALKIALVEMEGRTWMDAYLEAQAMSAELVAGKDSGEGVLAFLEHRKARLVDQ